MHFKYKSSRFFFSRFRLQAVSGPQAGPTSNDRLHGSFGSQSWWVIVSTLITEHVSSKVPLLVTVSGPCLILSYRRADTFPTQWHRDQFRRFCRAHKHHQQTRKQPHHSICSNVDFTEARDSEWQWHQLGHMQVCNLLYTDNHASTPPLDRLGWNAHPIC